CRSEPTVAPAAAAPVRRCAALAPSPPRAARAGLQATLYVSRSCASSSFFSPSHRGDHRGDLSFRGLRRGPELSAKIHRERVREDVLLPGLDAVEDGER